MADKEASTEPKKRPAKTLREQAEKQQARTAKPRRFRKAAGKAGKPFATAGRGIGRVGRFVVPPYFRNSWRELRQVTWPNRKQTRQLTVAVMIFATIFGVLIAITDYGLDKLFKKVILKQ